MAGKFGVQNLIKVADVFLEGANIAEKFKNSKGTLVSKATLFMGMFDELMAITTADFSKLDDELKELDQADKDILNAHFKAKLNLEDDALEATIEKTFGMILRLESIVHEVMAMVASFKK